MAQSVDEFFYNILTGESIREIAAIYEEFRILERELVAYVLIAALLGTVAIWSAIAWRKHQRIKLRRRGIKRNGH